MRRRTTTSRHTGSSEARERLDAMIARAVDQGSAESIGQEENTTPEVPAGGEPEPVRSARLGTAWLRFSPSPTALIGVVCLAVIGVFLMTLVPHGSPSDRVSVMVSGSASPVDVGDARQGPSASAAGPGARGSAKAEGPAVVHVVGAVKHPGLVRVPEGALTFDALQAAGGATDEAALEALNLAEPVRSGQQIKVLTHEEASHAGSPQLEASGKGTSASGGGQPSPSGTGRPSGKIDLNRASVEELQTLPKVGPKLAQRIVDWRTEHGPFRTTNELDDVPGIGPALMAALEPLVTV